MARTSVRRRPADERAVRGPVRSAGAHRQPVAAVVGANTPTTRGWTSTGTAPVDGPGLSDLAFLPLERVSLYGTELWDELTPEQRIELSKQELASVASTGLWFEIILIQMLARYAYHQDAQRPHTQYALTEIGDETRHVIMFAKALDRMGTPTYRPNRFVHHLARVYKATARGTALFAPVLVAEELTDRLQRATMNDESIHPLVRMVNRIHVIEEARHVRFAREEVARLMPTMGPVRQAGEQHRRRGRVGDRRRAC